MSRSWQEEGRKREQSLNAWKLMVRNEFGKVNKGPVWEGLVSQPKEVGLLLMAGGGP